MTFEETKHLIKPEPKVIHTQDCYMSFGEGSNFRAVKVKPGTSYTNPNKEIKTRRNRKVKHYINEN